MKNRKFYSFLVIVLALVLLFLKFNSLFIESDLMWDASVYIGMGKYIYSGGKSGLWESSRALIWPLIIGFFWKVKIDYIFWAKFIAVLLSVCCVILAYIISKEIFDSRTGFYTALFFALSPAFFLLGNMPLSDIPSAFFLLLGVHFFIRRMHKHSGFFFGLSFMTRFFQIFFLIPILMIYIFLLARGKIKLAKFFGFILFFSIPILLFLLLNLHLYGNLFYPFAVQSFMTNFTGWIFHQSLSYYFVNIFKENYLVLFSLAGVALLLKQGDADKILVLLMFVVPFIIYNFAGHKEMRFMISILPFLFMLASSGFLHIVDLFKKNQKVVLFVLLAVFMIQVYPQLKFYKHNSNFDVFYDYIKMTTQNSGIWVSNPSFIVYSSKKADELIYYPLYGSEKARELQNKASGANLVMLNTCDILPCRTDDTTCVDETFRFIKILKNEMRLIHNVNVADCDYFIFEK